MKIIAGHNAIELYNKTRGTDDVECHCLPIEISTVSTIPTTQGNSIKRLQKPSSTTNAAGRAYI